MHPEIVKSAYIMKDKQQPCTAAAKRLRSNCFRQLLLTAKRSTKSSSKNICEEITCSEFVDVMHANANRKIYKD
jgi:hypothetical protein